MGKTFKSVDDLVGYIRRSCHPDALKEIGEKSVNTMKEVTQDQYDGETGQMIDCIDVVDIDSNSVKMAWQDNGDWYSVLNGNHMYAPIAHEMGKVWGEGHNPKNPVYKPATTLEETSTEIIEGDAPNTYRKVMRSKGFDVR
ncbi:MAG: hypothetical protein ACRC18_07225 [Cetobacterium sp.]